MEIMTDYIPRIILSRTVGLQETSSLQQCQEGFDLSVSHLLYIHVDVYPCRYTPCSFTEAAAIFCKQLTDQCHLMLCLAG